MQGRDFRRYRNLTYLVLRGVVHLNYFVHIFEDIIHVTVQHVVAHVCDLEYVLERLKVVSVGIQFSVQYLIGLIRPGVYYFLETYKALKERLT